MIEPELLVAFLIFMIAPLLGFYAYAHIQAFKYKHGRGANSECSLKSTYVPP